MTSRSNIAASVRARLFNRAKADGVEFGLMLTRFALERILYRLSVSKYRNEFLLKGALLFDLWFDAPLRPTRDVDFLGFGSADLATLETTFRAICRMGGDDGLVFDPQSVRAQEIRKEANYAGVRITLVGTLDGARCPVQADIGFGDAVTPAAEERTYPVLLGGLPAPTLLVYPRYTVIAEKLEAIVSLGIANTRLKDFFDLWVLTRHSDLEKGTLRAAIKATFERRHTDLPASIPIGLSEEFGVDTSKQAQWRGFLSRNSLDAPPLDEVVKFLREYFDFGPNRYQTATEP